MMQKMERTCFAKYCTGCGLCEALGQSDLSINGKGFSYPTNYNLSLLQSVCPASGKQFSWMDTKNIWGRYKKIYIGWSNCDITRNLGSSGGILTEIAKYLLNEKLVDGIIQTREDDKNPTRTVTVISRSAEEVSKCMGSRYSISHPLSVINKLKKNESYALIAKPCDIVSMRNYMAKNPAYKNRIKYMFAFFCAGLPSQEAQQNLLNKLGFSPTTTDKCVSLRYRGNGWPGYTTAIDNTGKEYQMTYSESWGKILGRDLMLMCRFCMDGIGEAADISCGDAWFIGDDGFPDFSEHDGRNVVFCRTTKGKRLFDELITNGLIHAENYNNFSEDLAKIQYAQKERRETMLAKVLALKLLCKKTPHYPLSYLYKYYKGSNVKKSYQVFKGTIKRVLQGKM